MACTDEARALLQRYLRVPEHAVMCLLKGLLIPLGRVFDEGNHVEAVLLNEVFNPQVIKIDGAYWSGNQIFSVHERVFPDVIQ